MNTLPKYLRFAPVAFYVAAAIVWIFTVWSNWALLHASNMFLEMNPDRAEQALDIIKSDVFVKGFIQAAPLAAYGAMVQVLIAIHDRLGGVKEAAE